MNPTSDSNKTANVLTWLWYWLPPLMLMVVIFFLSAQPTLPQAPGELLDALLKKLMHAVVYALLFLLLFRAWNHSHLGDDALNAALLTTAAYAVSDELHQAFVPGRRANWYDVLIDVSAALLLCWLLRSGRWARLFHGKDNYLAE